MTRHVTVDEVIAYHDRLFHADGQAPAPLLDFGKLESAVLRPQATAFQQDAYPDLAEKAAALLQGIAIAHPFLDGNKRAALGATLLLLELNGVTTIAEQDPLYDLVIEVIQGRCVRSRTYRPAFVSCSHPTSMNADHHVITFVGGSCRIRADGATQHLRSASIGDGAPRLRDGDVARAGETKYSWTWRSG